MQDLFCQVSKMFHSRKSKSNLLPFQSRIFADIQSNRNIMIAQTDKNLGPVGVNPRRYIQDGLKHIQDKHSYEIISTEQGRKDADELRLEILDWIVRNNDELPEHIKKYIRHKVTESQENPFGTGYLLYKIHKEPISTRLICSDCGSLPHSLGKWVNEMLQPIMFAQRSYIRNSFELKDALTQLGRLPPGASLYTYDAIGMYPNIEPEECIATLATFLRRASTQEKFPHYRPEPLIQAIEIVMRNNRFWFGDVLVKQIRGIAMGMSPAPPLANIFVAIHEEEEIWDFVKQGIVHFLRRFIDDGIGIWIHHPDPTVDEQRWNDFKKTVNNGCLDWEFSPRSNSVIFLDTVISIVDRRIETSLYEKPLALHLYLPPHSCHPPGVTKGLVMGEVLRISYLCSREEDIHANLRKFYRRLCASGHNETTLNNLFNLAIENAEKYMAMTLLQREQLRDDKREAAKRRVYLKIPFHPSDPPRRLLQKMWRNLVSNPPGRLPLNQLHTNNLIEDGVLATVPIDRLTIAYRRAPNMGNLLSYRNIEKCTGLKVSSYID